jgi:hypothetical protein
MKRIWAWVWLLATFAPVVAGSVEGPTAPAASFDHDVASEWFELYEVLVRETPGFSAPVVARTYAYSAVILYEALVFAMPARRSLAESLPGLPALPLGDAGLHPVLVANAALAQGTRVLFGNVRPKNALLIDAMEGRWEARYAAEVGAEGVALARAQGLAVADAILAWAAEDGGEGAQFRNFDAAFVVPAGGSWQPTPREVGAPFPPLQPDWGDHRPFVPKIVTCAPPGPPAYSEDPTSALYQEALEVVAAVTTITPWERETAQYWADDAGSTATPAGHWFSIATHVLQQQRADLESAAAAYVRLGMALNDAFISCWATKFRELYIRPITYIQRVIDPQWNLPRLTDPLLTPPFPEYTSGHSVVSAAAATVLTALFGDDTPFIDNFHIGRGFDPRPYRSFWEAAEEAANSRLVGGIHFRSGIEHGVDEGRCVAEQILAIELLHAGE